MDDIRARVIFQSTPSARRATGDQRDIGAFIVISIHALREEGDGVFTRPFFGIVRFQSTPSARRATWLRGRRFHSTDISIHALREEGDGEKNQKHQPVTISIHALREEGDRQTEKLKKTGADFNPRPPRGGRRFRCGLFHSSSLFQSTPSARRATVVLFLTRMPPKFQSTPSARRATQFQDCYHVVIDISIHALREEGDSMTFVGTPK